MYTSPLLERGQRFAAAGLGKAIDVKERPGARHFLVNPHLGGLDVAREAFLGRLPQSRGRHLRRSRHRDSYYQEETAGPEYGKTPQRVTSKTKAINQHFRFGILAGIQYTPDHLRWDHSVQAFYPKRLQ